MKIYLVCYDISDDDVRRRASNVLERHGDRVQGSVFEVRVHKDSDLDILQRELDAFLEDERNVRFYRLCERCIEDSWSLDERPIGGLPSTIVL